MLELHTLGALDLRGPDDADCRAVLQQPKRLGLLAYLAASAPRRFHRRDSLLALFWPDLDQEHARAALRRSLYFIRGALGAEVIEGRGDDEVGVPETALWCDASAFDAAIAAGNAAGALELYRGDLLEGFYVAGAPDYQDWLDRERTRLRDAAARAAWSLADASEREGQLADAARWARRGAELTPDDEGALRRVVGLLDRAGDRAAALRAYDDFAKRLATEYELEPSGETRSLVEAIRARPESAPAAPRVAPAVSAGVIAVFPFAARGDAHFAYLGEGMVDLLATELDGAGDVRTVDTRALLGHLVRNGARDLDPAAAAAIAARFGAGRFVLGSVIGTAGRLGATASLYGASGAAEATAQASVEGEAQLFGLVDDLARQLLAARSAGPGARLARLAALTTGSLPALKAYLQGESHLRAGRYFDAMDCLQRAVSSDPTFALAHYRLAAAAAGSAMPELARRIAEQGAGHRERLSGHDRLLFDAQRAWLSGAVGEAEAHYNTITGTHPDDVEAWFLLGDLLFHSNPLRGRSAAEARPAFERALELEPDHVTSLVHLVRIAAIEGRLDEAQRLAGRVLELSPDGDQALAMRAFRAYAAADRNAIVQVKADLQRARAVTVAVAFSDVALYSGDLAGAESLARGFIQSARSAEMRALCHVLIAHLALARGDVAAAWTEIAAAESLDRPWGLATRGLFAALPFVEVDEAAIVAARDALREWDASAVPPSNFLVFAMHNGLHPHIRLYLLVLLESRLGRLDEARLAVAALAALPLPPGAEAMARHLVHGARARLAWAEGNPEVALAFLDQEPSEAWFQLTVASPFYAQAFERYMRGEVLKELGRTEEAEGWIAAIAERSPYEIVYRR